MDAIETNEPGIQAISLRPLRTLTRQEAKWLQEQRDQLFNFSSTSPYSHLDDLDNHLTKECDQIQQSQQQREQQRSQSQQQQQGLQLTVTIKRERITAADLGVQLLNGEDGMSIKVSQSNQPLIVIRVMTTNQLDLRIICD